MMYRTRWLTPQLHCTHWPCISRLGDPFGSPPQPTLCTRTAAPPPHGSVLYVNTKVTQSTRIFFFTCCLSRELFGVGVCRAPAIRGGVGGGVDGQPLRTLLKWYEAGPQIFSSSSPISGDCASATPMVLSWRGETYDPDPLDIAHPVAPGPEAGTAL